MASRAELVASELRPAIDAGTIVLLDRFFLSTYAYQIAGRGLVESDVRSANMMATDGLVPDLTLLLTPRRRRRPHACAGLRRAVPIASSDQAAKVSRTRVEQAFAEFATRRLAAHARGVPGRSSASTRAGRPMRSKTRVLDALASRFHELRTALGVAA